MSDHTENKPDPVKIMKTLISLYADQEGVIIKCDIEVGGKTYQIDTSENQLMKKFKKAESNSAPR